MDFFLVNIISSFVYFLASPGALGSSFPHAFHIVSILTQWPVGNHSPLLWDLSDSCPVSVLLLGALLTSFCTHPPFTRTHRLSANLSGSPVPRSPDRGATSQLPAGASSLSPLAHILSSVWVLGIPDSSLSPSSGPPQKLLSPLGRLACSLMSFRLWVTCPFLRCFFPPLPSRL